MATSVGSRVGSFTITSDNWSSSSACVTSILPPNRNSEIVMIYYMHNSLTLAPNSLFHYFFLESEKQPARWCANCFSIYVTVYGHWLNRRKRRNSLANMRNLPHVLAKAVPLMRFPIQIIGVSGNVASIWSLLRRGVHQDKMNKINMSQKSFCFLFCASCPSCFP